jgi:CTP synthase (UTP-ammonia lyase)
VFAGREDDEHLTEPDSMVARIYGKTAVQEEYLCNFGVNPNYLDVLRSGALALVGSDPEGTMRAVELPGHLFFLGTLFLPQHRSIQSNPHPIISAFLKAASTN